MTKKRDIGSTIFKVRKSRNRPALKSVVYAKPKRKTIREMVARAAEIKNHIDAVKPLYGELDEITLALATLKPEKLELWGVAIVDNFRSQNTSFKTIGISRYSLQFRGGR